MDELRGKVRLNLIGEINFDSIFRRDSSDNFPVINRTHTVKTLANSIRLPLGTFF